MKLDLIKQIELFKEFIESNYLKELHKIIQTGRTSLVLNFQELSKFDIDLSELLLEEPEDLVKAAEMSIEQFEFAKNKKIRVRFYNLPSSQNIQVRNIRSVDIGKFLCILGIVRQASDVRPQVTSAKFECPSCGNVISILQIEQTFKEPSRCSCGRRGRFRLLSKDLVDAQRLIIEEPPEILSGGEQPKRISVFLKGDLVEPKMERKTTPGSKIRIYGVVKEIPIALKTGTQSVRYDLIIDTNYIESLEERFEEINIDEEEEKSILDLSKDSRIFEKLVNTIAPSIYGHEDVKLALLLQLMSGVKKVRADGTKTRGDIHILLVGDPGCGKSQLLKFISNVTTRGRYVSGKGATSAGLTATVVRDEFLKGWALEAGALVLSSGGIACLDELDKMTSEDTAAMHEALEQQTITIAKANIQATLKAETSVLAAANPKLGRFDPYVLLGSQISMPLTLINRFDLIFPIKDIPSKDKDEKIASHILDLHKEETVQQDVIDLELFKKYIIYAKQKVTPKLTDVALNEIKNFYVTLRNQEVKGDGVVKSVPITARQLEALIRLAESSARIRLSNKVSKEDSKRAINILKHCLMSVGYDYETQSFDIDRISTGITSSQRNKIIVVRSIIEDFTNKGTKSISVNDIVLEATKSNINEDQVDQSIEQLKKEGFIYEPRRGFVQKI